jgi:uncharacterized protein (TIGR02996 family)
MTDREALVAAILADPTADAPRLVLADWLEEHGDPDRAAFVRLQCAAARLGHRHPGWRPLRDRAWALEREHGPAWRKPLTRLNRAAPFARGFVEWFGPARDGEDLRLLAAARRREPADAVGLVGDPGRLLRLLADERLTGVRRLTVEMTDREDAAADDVLAAALPAAADLTLVNGRLTHVPDAEVTRVPAALTVRGLSPDPGSTLGLTAGWVRRLDRLEVVAEGAGDAVASTLAAVRGLRLRVLRIDRCGLTITGAGELADAPLGYLRELSLAGNRLRDAGVYWLAAGRVLRPVTRLDLTDTRVRDDGVSALAASPAVGHLEELVLDGCPVGPDGAAALARSPHLGRLRRLSLLGSRVGPNGVAALLRSANLPRLERLDVPVNTVRLLRRLRRRFPPPSETDG